MSSSAKKSITIFLSISFLILVGAIVLGFFLFKSIFKSSGEIEVNYSSRIVHIDNSLPMGDEMGKKLDSSDTKDGLYGYIEFSINEVKGKKTKYEIYLEEEKVDAKIDSNYIKLYLTDMSDKAISGFEGGVIPSFKSLKVASDRPSGKVLYRGKLNAYEEKKYKLRVWLSDASAIDSERKEFKSKLGVRVY